MTDTTVGSTHAPALSRTGKSARRRQSILQRAAELFDKYGYSNTSIDDIARAAGIKREAVYYYFRNRAEILVAVIRPQNEGLISGLSDVMKSDLPATKKLELAIRNHMERFDRHSLEMTVGLRDALFEAPGDVYAEMRRGWKTYERMWTDLIAGGQASGEFVALGNPKMIAFGVLGMCNWLGRWYNPRRPVSIDELIQTYVDLVSQGLGARPRPVLKSAQRRRRA